ncbi:hypothetical protein Rhe02_80960 [Rhizocola hellebori]|uniref:Uncharacterized protein n=1 Tax=Rhizocola hellebori TaxID=1392758 RepID=A0A8J3VK34_9ACTN|nr:M12 family metallo-peptidase [Rhizocola hellebori]GIH10029.1 hypothetical protein Rhe02_80960 [Rhizocola hellebori]
MRNLSRFGTTLVVIALTVSVPLSVPNAAADPGGGRGATAAGDGFTGVDAAGKRSGGPDAFEKAALDNNIGELAMTKDLGKGAPLVPQSPAVNRGGTVEKGGEGAGPTATTAPAAKTSAPGRVAYRRPAAGTSATVRFNDAAAVNAATLPPYLRDITSSAKRTRTVGIDAQAMSTSLAAATVTLELFADVSVPLQTTVAPSPGAGFQKLSSSTYSAGGPSGTAIVSVIGNDVHASIWKGTQKYGIKPLGNGLHLVFEDGRVFPGEDEPAQALQRVNTPDPAVAKSVAGAGIAAAVPVIDVMVAFDDLAQAAYGSVAAAEADIIDMINVSNMSYLNSNNDQQLALTNIVDLNYTPNAADGTDDDFAYIRAIRSKVDGIVDSLHTDRDANGADLFSVIGNVTSFCGVAYSPISAVPAESDAFSLVDYNCAVGNLSFPHELGHNMCADHDPINATDGSPCQPDGFGHFGIAENLRTIMSYANVENGCPTCVRVPYFSNPNVTYNGWTTGVLGANDNSRVLEITDTDVSNYRAPQFSAAVAGLDGISCIFNTIEDAITMAPAGSTIYIAPGTYPAQTANLDYNISKNLDLVKGTFDCEPTVGGSATDVVLQRNAGSINDSVVEVFGSAAVRFDRITIEGGNAAEGTLYVSGSAIATLDNAVVRNGNNPSATVGGGGVRVSGPSAQLISVNDTQIEGNTATFGGGGIYVDDGTVTLNGAGNVELNTTAGSGGGIYATNHATVVVSNDADVYDNDATSRGGGVFLDGASTLAATGGATFIGFTGLANTANLGAGIYAVGSSTVTVGTGATVRGNSAGFGGGIYGLGAGTIVRLDSGGVVTLNTATSNGAGVLVTQGAAADLNAGADVTGNSATGFGGGLAVFSGSTLDADGDGLNAVDISGNTAGTVGGGIYTVGVSTLDTVHIVDNTATAEGGGLYIGSTGTVTMTEGGACVATTFTKEHYCNEFRDNTAGTTGGAIYATGGDFSTVQTAFVGNSAFDAAVIMAFGDSVVSVRASLLISNTESNVANEALITGHDTTSTTLVGVTSANQTEALLDTDDTATATTSRVLTTTGTLGLVAVPAGNCNIGSVASGLPGLLVAVITFTSTARTDYMPAAGASSLDRCNILGGHTADIDGTAVLDVAPAGPRDYDVGAFEAPA